MTTVDSRALLKVQDRLLRILAEQQQYRPIRTGLIDRGPYLDYIRATCDVRGREPTT